MLDTYKFSILCLAETFLNQNGSTNTYKMARDQLSDSGGGLVSYIHKSLQIEHLKELDDDIPESINIRIIPSVMESYT